MLRIRPDQLTALERDFDTRLVDVLVQALPATARRLPDCRERAFLACQRAREYGFQEHDDLEWFVVLDFRYGQKWELGPDMDWALEVLSSVESEPAGRRHRLERRIQRWENAR